MLALCLSFILFSQAAEVSNTELSKQREIEKEKEDLMDEGDFLEYKVNCKYSYCICSHCIRDNYSYCV